MTRRAGWTPFGSRSPNEIRRFREAIAEFRSSYVAYLNRTLGSANPPTYDAARTQLIHLAVEADKGVAASGVQPVMYPPPMFGGPARRGIIAIAFAHEDDRYEARSSFGARYQQPYELVIDCLDTAEAYLAAWEDEETRRRRNPMYWIDRMLRFALGLPVYLLSLVLGFDPRGLNEGTARALWFVSLIADAAGIYGFGRLVGWW